MAKYLILIYGDEQQWAARTPQEAQKLTRATGPSRPRPGRPSSMVRNWAGESPRPRCARTRPVALAITDGPFLETKEALGGYYLIEAADLDEVIASGLAAARGVRRATAGWRSVRWASHG